VKQGGQKMFKLPELTYDYAALAPWVSTATMQAHHDHHHQTYVDKLNAAVEKLPADFLLEFQKQPLEFWLQNLEKLPTDVRTAIKNHGGGHYNHSLFWQVLTPHSDGQPTGELAVKLDEKYGSFQNFVDQFETAAIGLFGSGWAWLTSDLEIISVPLQDLPATSTDIIGLDVWEHAYYLDYKWARADYVKAWWEHVDWDFAAARFAKFTENW